MGVAGQRGARMRVFVAAVTLAAAIAASPSAPAAASATSTYQSLPAPGRVLDTRSGASTIDGTSAGVGAVRPGETLQLRIGGRAGVPADAVSVVLNVTVTEPLAPGYVTVHACGTDRPNASNLNYVTGQTVANFVVARLGSDAGVCLYSFATTHLIVDVAGYFTSSDALSPLDAPGRLLDSRPGAGTIDGVSAGTGLVSGATEVRLQVGGRAGVPSDATSAVLNVTVTEPRADGFVTVYPCDSGRPTASNLNYVSGQTVPNAVLTKLSLDGSVCLYSLASTHLIADVGAYSRSVDVIVPLARPARLMVSPASIMGPPVRQGDGTGPGVSGSAWG